MADASITPIALVGLGFSFGVGATVLALIVLHKWLGGRDYMPGPFGRPDIERAGGHNKIGQQQGSRPPGRMEAR